MNQSKVLSFTSAFPPVEKMTETVMNFNYKRQFQVFVNALVNVCAFIAALATVVYQRWNEYDCSERVQLFFVDVKEKSIKFYNDVFVLEYSGAQTE